MSSKMMRGRKCAYLFLTIASSCIMVAGLMLLFVGILFAIPLAYTAFGVFYLKAKPIDLPRNIEANSFDQA